MKAQTLIAAFSALVALAALGLLYKLTMDFDATEIAEMKRDLAALQARSHDIPGPRGEPGPRGPPGPKGEKGDKGDSFPPEELAQIKEAVFKNRQSASGVLVELEGGTFWGVWNKPAYCPDNQYVCGISQKVEGNQGRGDDTAVNDIRIYCCKF